ncbi:Beta-lactamase [Gracilaria domingensis]|nr:Beta-lactamase [Gracilaria domingensis]
MCSFINSSILAKNRGTYLIALTRSRGRVRSLCGIVQPPSIAMHADRSIPEKINVAGFDICGVSVAAVETCLWIPSLSLAFDSGRCPRGVVGMRYMAITHGHCDHIHGLPLHLATRTLQQLPRPRYFLPQAIEDDVRNLVAAVGKLEHCTLEMQSVPLRPGSDEVELKKGWVMRSVQTKHTVPSQGYVVFRKRKKLKKEFLGMSGSELVALKQKGVVIEDVIQTPEIAYTGDTQLEAIRESEDFQKARILITEMTFIDEACTPSEAAQFGHIHLKEVIEKSDMFLRNEVVIFTHFSARYTKAEILESLDKLPTDLRRKSIAFGIGGKAAP